MGLLPHLCHIKYKWDNLNSTKTPQKLEFQDKGREESDKVKENIPEALSSNRTAVVIRVRIEAKKGRGEAKGGDLEKKGGGGEREGERKE